MTDLPSIDDQLGARPLAESAVRSLAELTAEIAAERAADKVAKKVIEGIFLHLGVDVTDKDQVSAMKDNLQFLTRLNRGAKEVKSAAIKTCVGAVLATVFTLLGWGFKDWIFGTTH